MALVASNLKYENIGTQAYVRGTLAFDNSYPTGGEALSAASVGLSRFTRLKLQSEQGYEFEVVYATEEPASVNIKAYSGASGTSGATSAGTPAGTVSAPTFTGSALAAHGHNIQATIDEVISVTAGTGVSAALANLPVGNIMAVYQTAGGVTGPSHPIPASASLATLTYKFNLTTGILTFLVADAVTSATVTYQRAAVSTTSAGTPAGTNSAPIFTGSALATHTHSLGAAAGGEVSDGADLSALTAVEFEAYGY